jgi:uncharacterized protein (TIGR01777 family)
MRILIAGSSGLVGTALRDHLNAQGHEVAVLKRSEFVPNSKNSCGGHCSCKEYGEILWNPDAGLLDLDSIEGFDAFVNLAGENIFHRRWSEQEKKLILESRVKTTELLCTSAAQLKNPPKVIVNASAIGYYGNRSDEVLDESSSLGSGFLAEVCKEWEAATLPANKAGIRVVNLRLGVVLSPDGGALKKMLIPFKFGLGGPIGTGQQYMSWIAIDDLVQIVSFVIQNSELSGPVNAVAPETITNMQLTKALGKQLSRPTFIPFPEFAVKLIFGEMGQETLLASARVTPAKLQKTGYKFIYKDIDCALKELLKTKE